MGRKLESATRYSFSMGTNPNVRALLDLTITSPGPTSDGCHVGGRISTYELGEHHVQAMGTVSVP